MEQPSSVNNDKELIQKNGKEVETPLTKIPSPSPLFPHRIKENVKFQANFEATVDK